MKVGRGETNHIFVDVDGTLLIWPTVPGSARPGERPEVNVALVEKLKAWQQASGGVIVIWTMGGKAHAEMARDLCGLGDAICIAKPDLLIDDAKSTTLERKFMTVLPDAFRWE